MVTGRSHGPRDAPAPRMHPWTLAFEDAALERDYRRDVQRQTPATFRLGLLLAMALFALYGIIDAWLGARYLFWTLAVRAVIVAAALLLYAFSNRSPLLRNRENVLLGFCLFMAVALAVIMILGGGALAEQYYPGFMLIIVASYLIMGVSFGGATLAALFTFSLYLLTEGVLHGGFDLDALVDSSFILSTVFVATLGAYTAEKQRRGAYCHGVLLERDRTESRHSALHDPLTGLPNRRLFMEKLAQAVARDARFGVHCAVMFVDLDAFKPLNDAYGHAFGDRLLKCAAENLESCVRDTDTVARFGGDEFVVLLEDLADAESANLLLNRILASFETPCDIEGRQVDVRISIGCALHPGDGETPRELLEAADKAMYRMKRQHGRR